MILITAYAEVEKAVEAMRLERLHLPGQTFSNQQLLASVRKAVPSTTASSARSAGCATRPRPLGFDDAWPINEARPCGRSTN